MSTRKPKLEPRTVTVMIDVGEVTIPLRASGYYHPELEEEIVFADEAIRLDRQIERLKTFFGTSVQSTACVPSDVHSATSTNVPGAAPMMWATTGILA
jgi:hypothetical protein